MGRPNEPDERAHLSIDDGFEPADGGAVNALLAEMDVANLLAELPPKQAAAIRLTRIRGYSVREAAKPSGLSERAVKVNIHRGVGRLPETTASFLVGSWFMCW